MRHQIIAFSLLFQVGCVGTIADSVSDPGTGAGPGGGDSGSGATGGGGSSGTGGVVETPIINGKAEFACDKSKVAADFPMHRLSALQYKNTLHDLFARVLGGTATAVKDADAIMASLATPLGKVPSDALKQINTTQKRTTYSRFDQDISQELIDNSYDTAVMAGTLLTNAARLPIVVGTCATDGNAGNDDTCLNDFIDRMGTLALRRPLTAAEKTFFKTDVYGSPSTALPAAYADVIAVMLLVPQFMYHVEHGGNAVTGLANTYELSAYELANRLSYDLWDTMPDVELTQAAGSGAILTTDGLATQVDRLLADARSQATFGRFFREWLRRDSLDVLTDNVGDLRFKAFAGKNVPTPMLRDAMITEVADFTKHYVFDTPGTVKDLLTSDLSFTRSQELANIYGGSTPVWDGTSAPPKFPGGERPGLLTRAAFHAYKSPQTRPVMKGVFIKEAILCDVLPPPPPSVVATEPMLTPDMTTREKLEEMTQQKGSICVDCHGTAINPMGFASENYDSLGRIRSEQIMLDPSGAELGRKPINTSTIPWVLGDADDRTVAGMGDLMTNILDSGKAEACLARQIYRYTFITTEDVTRDGCALKQMNDTIKDGGSISKVLRESILVSNFRQRVIP